jgi:hypothetical protein
LAHLKLREAAEVDLRINDRIAMSQIDPLVKAAECERVIRVLADPDRRSVLLSLRSLWLSLENDKSHSERSLQEMQKIAQIHAELMYSYRNGMN